MPEEAVRTSALVNYATGVDFLSSLIRKEISK